MEELLARIRAIARRPGRLENTMTLNFADLSLDGNTHELKSENQTVSLSKKETALLEYLIKNAGQTLTRVQILSYIWGPDSEVEEGNLILIAVIIGIALYNWQDLMKKELKVFKNQLMMITSRLQSDITIPHSWLAQSEYDNRLIIDILDNQVPFIFQGSWTPPTKRQVLIQRLQDMAAAEHVLPDTKPVSSALTMSSIFRIDGDFGDSYYGVLVLMKTRTSYITLNLLSDIPSGYLLPPNEILLYLILYLLGQTAIIFISWYFIGRSMKPVEEATQKQHEFIAAAPHELRSPLAVIQTGLSTIPPAGEHRKIIETARKECHRMSRLINDMLLLASSDAKTWPLQKELLDIDTILIECYEAFLPAARKKRQNLHLDLPENMLPRVYGDRQWIEQILTILIDNALSYTPAGNEIRIYGYFRNNWLTVDVEDDGPGISDADKERIFDRFYRTERSRNDKKHFGLGLSIAKELTDLHSGRLKVRDSASGGAVFSLQLRIQTKP